MAQRVGLNLQHLPRYKSSPKGPVRCLLSLQRCCCSLLDDGGQYFKKIAAKLFIGFFSPPCLCVCECVCVRVCVSGRACFSAVRAGGRRVRWCVCVCECNCYTLSPRSAFTPAARFPGSPAAAAAAAAPLLPLLRGSGAGTGCVGAAAAARAAAEGALPQPLRRR